MPSIIDINNRWFLLKKLKEAFKQNDLSLKYSFQIELGIDSSQETVVTNLGYSCLRDVLYLQF